MSVHRPAPTRTGADGANHSVGIRSVMATATSTAITRAANVVSVVSAVIVATTFGRHLLLGTAAENRSIQPIVDRSTPTIGSVMRLGGWDFREHAQTLVIANGTACNWTSASEAFHEEVIRHPENYQVLELFAQPANEISEWLKDMGMSVPEVRQADVAALGIKETPAILLVGADGRIRNAWMGKLSQESQADMRRTLGLPALETRNDAEHIVGVQELAGILARDEVPVVDVRSDNEYRASHLVGAMSLPLDEFDTRALHELPTDGTVLAICGPCPLCDTSDEEKLKTPCGSAQAHFALLGFSDVRLVMAGPDELRRAGLSVTEEAASDIARGPQKDK